MKVPHQIFSVGIKSAPISLLQSPIDSFHVKQFHLRAYCVASGTLTLYLYTRTLALFSAVPYASPAIENETVDMTPHLTNTSLHTHRGEEVVRLFDDLVGCDLLPHIGATSGWKFKKEDADGIFDQMSAILAETFKAALESPVHFQV